MKKWMALSMAAVLGLAACGSNDELPKACTDLADSVKEMAGDMPEAKDMLKQLDADMEKAREEWKNMSDDDRKKAEQECVSAQAEMEKMKGMMEEMKELQNAQ
ncbi:hypothetical protein L0B52_03405 [Suttonella sp. R2A3]|uniref:hypothetical protein n=1 Tax=Suttonella sp. R2A3 TaxID=2908648 RepID=UPI001F3D7BB4|nr:hypothetical protein [Suttonella sp. R2A3]UJF25209.1 hypothetical protein L0B52_03405 [Suttonella sp. R2A3]